MRIDVWSDVVCPFCYIGKRRLEQALAESGDSAEIVWHSFQLDPSSSNDDPRDLPTRLGEKYGRDRAWGVQANEQVTLAAAEVGLEYHLEDAKSANTLDAHRLLHLALEVQTSGELPAGTQSQLKERLLKAYFVDGLPVGDADTLTTLAVEVGLPADRVAEVLAGTDYADDVAADQAQALAYGANGVPFFVIDQKYGVSGAQPLEVFQEALRRANADRKPVTLITAPNSDDTTCGPDGCAI
ncbi:DsbA family oxidoreductase [Kribbella sandramycini]|uniref:DsbA family oxidoreductase n=1 Tax=Kribbella sandramycini TaxID=60450 RepID=A0A7Y4L334_9ACTN|nr:DsbA family oxidoreductase [Kribbella sandramycini]MBB6571106.1 putative DsbA family dithiol-disulfide isomerase [Kribbella sandramycini]NOL43485.1 DsbA family oxidoreductase [Kribbella sandramycini]